MKEVRERACEYPQKEHTRQRKHQVLRALGRTRTMLGQCSWSRILGEIVEGEFREGVGGLDYVGSCNASDIGKTWGF